MARQACGNALAGGFASECLLDGKDHAQMARPEPVDACRACHWTRQRVQPADLRRTRMGLLDEDYANSATAGAQEVMTSNEQLKFGRMTATVCRGPDEAAISIEEDLSGGTGACLLETEAEALRDWLNRILPAAETQPATSKNSNEYANGLLYNARYLREHGSDARARQLEASAQEIERLQRMHEEWFNGPNGVKWYIAENQRLRPAAESWESYVAAQERKPVETQPATSKKWDDIVGAIHDLYDAPRGDHIGCSEIALAAANEIERLRELAAGTSGEIDRLANENAALRERLSVETAEPTSNPRALIEHLVECVTATSDRTGFVIALHAIEAALTAPGTNEWRPIATAPRGGKWSLLWWPDVTDAPFAGYCVKDKWFVAPTGDSYSGLLEPTHWMPLPPGPSEKTKARDPFPPGTKVLLNNAGFSMDLPRDGWVIETVDDPRPLKYRIRHPNGTLVDVLPELISVNGNGKP